MSDAATPSLPEFPPDAQVCGNCKLWRPHSVDARGWVGPCRLQPSRGLFPPTAPICDGFAARGHVTATASPATSSSSRGPVTLRPPVIRNITPTVRRAGENLPTELPGDWNMTRDELMQIFLEASGSAEVPLAAKWEGGMLQMVPRNRELQGKEIPIDAFFHKIVMVRDRLRTLEQKINGHPKLSDAEKVEMQQYITRVYGSLTTFNVLFRDKNEQFVGAKGEE